MRTLTQALTLTSIATAVRSGFRGALDGLSDATKAALVHLSGGRRLLKTYPKDGALMQVRRSTDNNFLDVVTLENGWIDAASAVSFAGAGDLFVVSGYDQRVTAIEQRRNLWAWSENFGNAVWGKIRGAVTQNGDGSWRFTATENAAGENSLQQSLATVTTSTTQSWWVKRGNTDWVSVLIWDGGSNVVRQWFNLATLTIGSTVQTGTVIALSAPSTIAQEGDWIKLTVTTAHPAISTVARGRLHVVASDGSFASVIGNYVDVLRAQAESGPATAYQRVDAGTEYPKRFVGGAVDSHDMTQSTATAQPRLQIVGGVASMVFDGTSDYFERPASDWPANLHTLPEVGANINTGTNNSTFDTGTGNWLFSSAAGTFSAVGGVAQITGVSDYVGKAIRNNGPVLGKNIILSLDVWSNFGGVNVFAQNPQSPFTTYVSTIVDIRTPRRVQLFVPNCPVPNILIAVTPWAGAASQIVNFDNVTVRELASDASVGVTVAMRINPSTAQVGALWSMRDNSTGFITLSRLASGAIQLEHRSDANITKSAASTATVAVGASATIVARWNFVNGTATVRINGVQQTLLTGMDIAGGLTARRHLVGASRPGTSVTGFFAGSLSDPIIIGAHATDADCQIIESALGATP